MDNWGSVTERPWHHLAGEITRVTLSKGVTTVGNSAFMQCRALTEVSLPSTLRSIGSQAFSLTGLTSLQQPKSLKEIGSLAFQQIRITELHLPDGLKSLGSYAFNNCKSLAAVTVGAKLTEVPVNPFSGCEALQSLTVDDGNPALRAEGGFLTDIRDQRLIFAPYGRAEETVPPGVQIIGADCFTFNTVLRKISLPDSVRIIADNAFQCCSALSEITLPEGLEKLGSSAFHRTGSLTRLDLPATVTEIGELAFSYSALTALTLPEGIDAIAPYTFFRCGSLKELHLPASLEHIDATAFEDCGDALTIWAPKDSLALRFARENGLKHRAEKAAGQ